jgi:cell division septal protein FtsQ
MSFFSSPTSNRRIKSGREKRAHNLLEVSTRPNRENRLQIRHRFSVVVKVVLLLGLVGGVAFGGRGLVNRLIWENPSYALADIRVATDGLLTRVQVLELLEVWEGKNIFTVDVAKMKRELDALPQVEKAEIQRHLPDRLEIKIVERQPVAWVAASAEVPLGVGVDSLLVDTRGFVMRTRKVLPEHLALPRITGVVMEDVAPGQKLPTAEALAALELIKLSVEDLRWQPRVVDVSKGYCLVVTDDRRAKVTFGFDNIDGQLGRLRQLLDYVEPQNRELQSVNLMLERNIPVVFAPPPVPPTLPVIDPKTGKPKPGAKGTPVAAQLPPLQGGVSGGVVQPPAASIPNPVTALPPPTAPKGGAPAPVAAKAPAASADHVARRPEPPRIPDLEPPASKKTKADPERVLKVAKLSEPPPARPKEAAEKPVRRKSEREREEEEPQRPPKAVRASEPAPKSEARSKPAPQVPPEPHPRTLPPASPPSVPPSDTLRKLFNPHG